MNTAHPTRFYARCTLWMGALLAAAAVQAGPAEDTRQAEELLINHDLPTAMTLLRKAADQDYPLAQARLGDLMRLAGYNEEALALYRKAADKGEPHGEVGLGYMYADGLGVKKDEKAALEWYRKAEQKNYAGAFDALARAHRTGTLGLEKDPVKAADYEQRAKAQLKTAAARESK